MVHSSNHSWATASTSFVSTFPRRMDPLAVPNGISKQCIFTWPQSFWAESRLNHWQAHKVWSCAFALNLLFKLLYRWPSNWPNGLASIEAFNGNGFLSITGICFENIPLHYKLVFISLFTFWSCMHDISLACTLSYVPENLMKIFDAATGLYGNAFYMTPILLSWV